MPPNLHALAEERSLAIHRLIASELTPRAPALERARSRVTHWLATREVRPEYAEAWRQALDGPLSELRALLCDPGEHACALRQTSPFAGAVDPRTRWRIWREVRTAMGV